MQPFNVLNQSCQDQLEIQEQPAAWATKATGGQIKKLNVEIQWIKGQRT
jgi:hypothetical protein